MKRIIMLIGLALAMAALAATVGTATAKAAIPPIGTVYCVNGENTTSTSDVSFAGETTAFWLADAATNSPVYTSVISETGGVSSEILEADYSYTPGGFLPDQTVSTSVTLGACPVAEEIPSASQPAVAGEIPPASQPVCFAKADGSLGLKYGTAEQDAAWLKAGYWNPNVSMATFKPRSNTNPTLACIGGTSTGVYTDNNSWNYDAKGNPSLDALLATTPGFYSVTTP
jgi:hypothetical protein